MKTSDEILVQKILDGDESSFRILVDRYKITGDDIPNRGLSIESKSKLTTTWGRIKQTR